MDIMQSALGLEIDEIRNSANKVTFHYRAQIHANGLNLDTLKLISIDTTQDFDKKFADETVVKIMLGAGAYSYKVYPFIDNLEITIFREPRGEVGEAPVNGDRVSSQRFRATLLNPAAPMIQGNSMNQPSEDALDLTNLLELDFQLQDKAIEQLRLKSTGTIFRDQKVEDIIRFVLTKESKDVDVDSKDVPLGVELVKPGNDKKYDHIVIPQGIRSVDVPQYLHDKYGVYPTGFCYYLFNKTWYVFPPFDNTRFDQSQKTMTIIRVPENRMPNVERTFRRDGNNIVAIATGKLNLENDSEKVLLNQGNGIRFTDANLVMGEFVDTRDNVALSSRGKANNEFTTLERPTGINNVQMSPNRISANKMLEYSRLAQRDGVLVQLSWENSDPYSLFPGMQIKLLYLEEATIREIYGTLVFAHHYTRINGIGVTTGRHSTTTNLAIFAKRKVKVD
jgi:hypothetical protein